MTATGTALRLHLLDEPDVTALVGTRIYPRDRVPQGCARPYLTCFEVFGTHRLAHDGPGGQRVGRYQIDVWAETHDGARSLADVVRIALNGWSEGNEADQVQAAWLLSEMEMAEPEVLGRADLKLSRITADYGVQKREAVT